MLNNILTFLVSREVQDNLLLLKIFFGVLSFAMVVFVGYTLTVTRWFRWFFWFPFVELLTGRPYGTLSALWKWKAIQNINDDSYLEASRRIVIGCHDMLEVILRRMVPMYQVGTFAQRLARVGQGTFSDLPSLWEAHEAYRKLLKDPNLLIEPMEVKKTMLAYKKAFEDLGILK
jgi:hypothetical protein